MTPTLTKSGSRRELPPVETGLAPSPESTTIARRNIAGKSCLDPTDLVGDRRSHHAAGIQIWILQKKDSASVVAHAGHGFPRHFCRCGRVRLAADHEEWAVGRLWARSVPAEKFLYEPIILPTRFKHVLCELRLCFSSTGLRDTPVRGKRRVFQHVAHLELRIQRLDGGCQDQQHAIGRTLREALVCLLRIRHTRSRDASQIVGIAYFALRHGHRGHASLEESERDPLRPNLLHSRARR